MRTLYKYEIGIGSEVITRIEVPVGSVFLKVHNQGDKLFVWMETTDDNDKETVAFVTFHTGDVLPSNAIRYLDTIFFNNDSYVSHVYMLIGNNKN